MQPMVAGQVDYVIGVDTHRDTNTAAIVEAATGGVVDDLQCPTDAMGYKRTYAFATKHAPGRRVWAIEGTGSYGSGLTTFLLERGEWVVEIDRPSRPHVATAPRATSSTPCAPPARPSRATTSPPRVPGATGRR